MSHMKGCRVSLPDHFNEPVLIEDVRELGSSYELLVRQSSGQLKEIVLSQEEFQLLVPQEDKNLGKEVDAENLRLLVESQRINLAYTRALGPRAINGLGDYFAFNLLPRLSGLYSKEQLATTDLPYVEPDINAVFLSHAHFDHVTHVQFLDPEIPVFLGVGTKLLMESMEETSNYCKYGQHECSKFRTGDKVKVDDTTVEPVHVDHSIPAAYGFIIHTSEGSIVYTGDLRVHGPRKDLTEDFMEKAKECEPIAMISEGTRMVEKEKRKNYSELQVQGLSNKIVSSTDRMVFSMRYSRDLDRFGSFYKVAKKNGRQIVVSPKTAHLLCKLLDDEHLNLPDPLKDQDILVYYKRKKSGGFDEKDHFIWERKFMDKMVTHEFVHKNQSKLVMDLDLYQFN